MALNNSGPISLGGSTVGQSINLELGVSATALASINSASFRNLAGVASGAISLSNFYGKSNVTYYMIAITPTGGAGTPWYDNQLMSVDGSGNFYIVLNPNANPGSNIVVKVTPTGTSATCYGITNTYSGQQTRYGECLGVNSSGVVLVGGGSYKQTFVSGNASTYTRVVSWNYITAGGSIGTSGSAQQYQGYPNSQVYSSSGAGYQAATADSSGKFYSEWRGSSYYLYGYCCCSGQPIYDMQSQGLFLNRYNSSGVLTNVQQMAEFNGYGYEGNYQPQLQSSGNILVVAPMGSPGPPNYNSVMSVNSGVTAINWSKQYYFTSLWSNNTDGAYTAIDSSDNLYMTGYSYYSGGGFTNAAGSFIWKIDSTGAVVWVKALLLTSPNNTNLAPRGCCVDSANNLYIVGTYSPPSSGAEIRTVIQKWNSSGTLQWCLMVTGSYPKYPNGRVPRMMPDGSLGVYIPTYDSWNPHILMTLPVDGSKTGTFTAGGCTFTISNASVTSYTISTYTSANRTNQGFGSTSRASNIGYTVGAYTPTASTSVTVI